jgi:hypothetical protein
MMRLRLMVPTGRAGAAVEEVEVAGAVWDIIEFGSLDGGELPEFSCVSYSWGPGRARHALYPGELMPARTPAVIVAAQQAFESPALWVDAFCVPRHDPDRAECLASLGAIYAAARRVVIVLSGATAAALDEAERLGCITDSTLDELETDDWVRRAWTYQEIVNSTDVLFTSETLGRGVPASGFFNVVGESMERFRRSHTLDQWQLRERYPGLDALESLVSDWRVSDYEERSAFRIMEDMSNRRAMHEDEVYFAMIGALTTEPPKVPPEASASEVFLEVCEKKGDFSFIYTDGDRGEPTWRPAPGALRPVLAWRCTGDRQTAERRGDQLVLERVGVVRPGFMSESARRFVDQTLGALGVDPTLSRVEIPGAIRANLRLADFKGDGEPIELERGYFFPSSPLPPGLAELTIVVAIEIFWPFGAPAFAVDVRAGARCVIGVGVFVGCVRGEERSFVLE